MVIAPALYRANLRSAGLYGSAGAEGQQRSSEGSCVILADLADDPDGPDGPDGRRPVRAWPEAERALALVNWLTNLFTSY